MDFLILVFLIIIFILLNHFMKNNRKLYNKHKNKLYIFLLIIIVILMILNKKKIKKENFRTQTGGSQKIKKLKKLCGLPSNDFNTSHCFADGTHQTCCMLGPKARKYADESGNPIGSASIEAFIKKNKRKPNQKELTSWCTCFGSKVCSYYANRFKDGTHIKFVNNPNSEKEIRTNVSPKCEGYFRDKFNIQKHATPGILKHKKELKKQCEKKRHSKLKKI